MTTVHFSDFLNGSAPKAVPVKGYATLDAIAKLAKKHCGLGSRVVEASYDENADLKAACTGSIYVGVFRRVGRFRVIDSN